MKTKNKIENIKTAKKFLEDKKAIENFARGIISKKELDEKGIKLAMPI